MKPHDAYLFCPRCAGSLIVQNEQELLCSACGNTLYVSPVPTANAIIENEKGEILLVKRARDPKEGLWDVPGGFVKPGESAEEAVRREIGEELGVEIQIRDFVGAFTHEDYEFEGVNQPILGLFVSAIIESGTLKASDDASEFQFFAKDSIPLKELAFDDGRQALEEYLKR